MNNTDWNEIKLQIKILKLKRSLNNCVIGAAVGLSPNHVSSVINGYIISFPARIKICNYFGIEYNPPIDICASDDTKM